MAFNKKDMHCPKCDNYPSRIIEQYNNPIEEVREWDGDCYALFSSNIGNPQKTVCPVCGTELDYLPQDDVVEVAPVGVAPSECVDEELFGAEERE